MKTKKKNIWRYSARKRASILIPKLIYFLSNTTHNTRNLIYNFDKHKLQKLLKYLLDLKKIKY